MESTNSARFVLGTAFDTFAQAVEGSRMDDTSVEAYRSLPDALTGAKARECPGTYVQVWTTFDGVVGILVFQGELVHDYAAVA